MVEVSSELLLIAVSLSMEGVGLSVGRWASNEGRTRWCDEVLVICKL